MTALFVIVSLIAVVCAIALFASHAELKSARACNDILHESNVSLISQQDALAAKIKEHGAPVGEFRPPKFLNQNAVVFRRARLATMDHLFTDKEMLRARKRFDRAVKRGWIKDHDPIVTTDGLGESWTEFTGTGGTAIITY